MWDSGKDQSGGRMCGYHILVHNLNQAVEQRMWMRFTSLSFVVCYLKNVNITLLKFLLSSKPVMYNLQTYTSAVIFFSFCRVHYRNNSVTDEPTGCKGACIPTWWTQKAQNFKDNNASRIFRHVARLRIETISFAMSVCLSARMVQLGFHWTDFREI